MAGPTCLPADVPDKLLTGIQNKAAAQQLAASG
jgi:hypothetical protein